MFAVRICSAELSETSNQENGVMARVVLAMSGGVDSSVAAHLLRQAGHDVIGVFMRHGQTVEACAAPTATHSATGAATAGNGGSVLATVLPILSPRADHKQGCCTASDAADARRVADRLDSPFYALDVTDSFGQIIDYFVAEYSARGSRTPNPLRDVQQLAEVRPAIRLLPTASGRNSSPRAIMLELSWTTPASKITRCERR